MIIEKKVCARIADNEAFLRSIIDALPHHIAVLDNKGVIIAVNARWESFARENCAAARSGWLGVNYLDVSRTAAQQGDDYARRAVEGLEAVIAGARCDFEMEYPCDAPGRSRWFLMTAKRSPVEGYVVVSHSETTSRREVEARLRQSELDFLRAQEVGQIGSWRLDTKRDRLTWSEENYRIFGVPQGKPLTYGAFLARVHKDDRDYVDREWQAALGGAPYDIEHRIVVEGRVKWVREKAYLEFDPSGALLGGFGITQDITDRKIAEERLREGDEFLRFALETSHTGAWDLDLVTHRAQRSEEHDRIFGYETLLDRWTYEDFLAHVLPEDRETVDARFERALATGGEWSFECRIRRVDGETRWIWAAGRHRQGGSGRRMAGVVQDITERKQNEIALLEGEANLRRQRDELEWIYRNTPIGLCLLDRDLRYLRINTSLAAQNGASIEAHLGRTVDEMVPALAGRVHDVVGRVFDTGRAAIDVEFSGETAADPGVRHDWSTSWHPMFDGEGRMVAVGVLVEDITQRKNAERALLEAAARHAFLLRLGDALRSATDAAEIQGTACRLLGEHLPADRVYYGDIYEDADLAIIGVDYFSNGLESIAGHYRLADFPQALATLKAGRPFVVADTAQAGGQERESVEGYRALGIGALAAAPLLSGGKLVWTLSVVSSGARDWRDDEISLIADVAERTWDAVKRARAEAALRESEQRERLRSAELQAVFDTAPIGLSLALDPKGESIRGNRACEQLFGVSCGAELSKKSPEAKFRVFQNGRELATPELPMQRAVRGEAVGGES